MSELNHREPEPSAEHVRDCIETFESDQADSVQLGLVGGRDIVHVLDAALAAALSNAVRSVFEPSEAPPDATIVALVREARSSSYESWAPGLQLVRSALEMSGLWKPLVVALEDEWLAPLGYFAHESRAYLPEWD